MSAPQVRSDRALDELEIRNLIARLAHVSDGGTPEEYGEILADDIAWEMPGAPATGAAEVIAGVRERRAAGTGGPGSNTRHAITSLAVRFDSDDEATVDAYWLFLGDTGTAPVLRMVGRYHDTYKRTQVGWRLSRRQIAFG